MKVGEHEVFPVAYWKIQHLSRATVRQESRTLWQWLKNQNQILVLNCTAP
jgi:hypothetical protein